MLLKRLFPDNSIDIICIAQNDTNYFFRNVGYLVVGNHGEKPLFASWLCFQYIDRILNTAPFQSSHHDDGLFHSFRPFVGISKIDCWKVEYGGLFGNRTAIAQYDASVHLKVVVVKETERLQELYSRIDSHIGRLDFFSCTRMRRDYDGNIICFSQSIKHLEQLGKLLLRIDVFLSMSTDQKVAVFI